MDYLRSITGGSSNRGDDINGIVGKGGKTKPIYEFDPSGLERAAKSAKELQNNPNASKLLDVAVNDSINRRLEIQKEQKALELKIEQAKMEGIKQQHDYSIEVLREEAKTHRTKAEYEDFLARKRNEDRLKLERDSQSDLLKSQEESVKRQEKLRKETIDYEYAKRISSERELANEFWRNKSAYKKETKDISLAKYSLKMDTELKRSEMIIKAVGSMIDSGVNSFYDNKAKFLAFTTGLCILTAGLVVSKRGVGIGLKQLESYLFTPKLIKEHHKISTIRRFISSKADNIKPSLSSIGLIYDPETEKTLSDIIESTHISVNNRGQLRNFLFYGPPGTGKTIFAKKLAAHSGLNYAIMTGGDVVPLQEKAVTEIHRVFDWANRSKGLILFLDEADAFLKKRDKILIGEDLRSALNSFLYRTGDTSQNVMLVLATNRPEQLDRAVTDRIDMVVEFPLPNPTTRERLFRLYVDVIVKKGINTIDFTLNDIMSELVKLSEGFSAREIAKLCHNWSTTAAIHTNFKFTKDDAINGLHNMKKDHIVKQKWDA